MGMFDLGATRYGGEFDGTDQNSPHVQLLRMVGSNKRVLEVGPGIGHVSRRLRAQGCEVTCIESHEGMAAVAQDLCFRMLVGDIESPELYEQISAERFDVIAFGDVLEHLRDPEGVLVKMRGLLFPEGYVVASIPNVAHRSVRLSLLFGEFNYADAGLLDRTHLRFFTRKTVELMVAEAGFRIAEMVRIRDASLMDSYLRKTASFPKRILLEMIKVLFRLFVRGEGLAYQFVIKCVPA
jgi:2-polyprenyl-3-methyl-5-hydroxy-6-metoxy-1,4-benzoquinol methylase